MNWCTVKPIVDTKIDLSQYPSVCDVGKQLKDRQRLQALCKTCNAVCTVDDYTVQWTGVDAMTYMFVLTEKATGQTWEWSVKKDFPKEGPQAAFERDYSEATLRHGPGIVRALEDFLEALQVLNPAAGYKMECTETGYRFFRPLEGELALVPFQLDILTDPTPFPETSVIHPELWDVIGSIEGEAGRSIARLVTRYLRLGVVFDSVEHNRDCKYHESVITGWRKRSDSTKHLVRITNRYVDLADPTLAHYYRYYNKGGPNGKRGIRCNPHGTGHHLGHTPRPC